jgi:ElaB/YqjD/DUF883 family membrane-anchored ribosome-binding protein
MAVSELIVPHSASDDALRPFLAANFDPTDFLNSTLPSWSSASQSSSLAELNVQTQTLVSQLNAQLTRLTSNLTQLTDDILRSGGRLSYEVEMLRGDSGGLTDVLDGLREEIKMFLPQGIEASGAAKEVNGTSETSAAEKSSLSTPDYVLKLNTLALIKDRLDTVIKVFGSAMDWPAEPVSSVLGTTTAAENQELQRKAKEYMQKQRSEISELVDAAVDTDDEDAYNTALQRVEGLRKLATVWKGTAEEKTRLRLVNELEKIIEDGLGVQTKPVRVYQI